MASVSVVLMLLVCLQLHQHGCHAGNLASIPACPIKSGSHLDLAHDINSVCYRDCGARMMTVYTENCRISKCYEFGRSNEKLLSDQKSAFDSNKRKIALKKHLPWVESATLNSVLNTATNPCWLVNDHYINLYSRTWKVPLLVAHRLTPKDATDIKESKITRADKECFRKDPRLSESAECDSYGDRVKGHMVPAEDMKYDETGYANSFVLSNISPTTSTFEGKTWTPLEKIVKAIAQTKTAYALSGPVFADPANPPWNGGHPIVQPPHYFKMILWCKSGQTPGCPLKALVYKVNTESGNVVHRGLKVADIAEMTKLTVFNDVEVTPAQLDHTLPQKAFGEALSSLVSGKKETESVMQRRSQTESQQLLSAAICEYIYIELTGFSDEGRLQLSTEVDYISGTVPTGQTVSIFELLPLPSDIDPLPGEFPLENITYNCTTMQLDIHTRSTGDRTIIPDILELHNATISFRAYLGPEDVELKTITFNGEWTLGDFTNYFTITEDSDLSQLVVEVGTTEGVSLDFGNFVTGLTGAPLPLPLPSLDFTAIRISGAIDLFDGGAATIILTGEKGDNKVHVILQIPVGGSSSQWAAGFAAEIHDLSFSAIVEEVSGADISDVPFFSSLSMTELGFTVASDFIDTYLLSSVYTPGSLLEQYSDDFINSGVAVYFENSFGGSDEVAVSMTYSEQEFTIDILYGSLTMQDLLSAIPAISIETDSLPPGVSDLLDLQILSLRLNVDTKELDIVMNFPQEMSYFDGFLTVEDVSIMIHAVLKTPTTVSVDVDGAIQLHGSDFDISISRDAASNKYVLQAELGEIPVSALAESFSAEVLPEGINELVVGMGFFDFSINNTYIAFPLAILPYQIHIAGTPIINGFSKIHMNAIAIRQESKTILVEAFALGSVSLANLIQQITGKSIHEIAIFNQNLDVALVISSATLPNLNLVGSSFEALSVTKGVSVQAIMQWPPNCASDPFCAVAQSLIGPNAHLILQGTFSSSTSFSLVAAIEANIHLGDGLTLSQAGLKIRVGTITEFGIEGILALTDPPIILTGGIYLGMAGVVLEMSMTGCWEEAFGASWLTICSIHLSAAMLPNIGLVGLALGGQVKLGDPSCGSQIVATGFIGINPIMPQENYYYFNIESEFTFSSILEAFCLDLSLPRVLDESGFPDGFMSSFSIFGKDLPHVPLSIPSGYRLNGTFTFLGLSGYADMSLGASIPEGIYVKISLPPINIGNGLMTITASSSDQSTGPNIFTTLALIPSFIVIIEARVYVSVLGISLETMFAITNEVFEFTIEGNMLNLFQASLTIYAPYGSINTASFRVEGYLRNDLFDKLQNLVKDALENSANAATAAIDEAQQVIDEQRASFDQANDNLENAQNEVNRAQTAFDDAVNELNRVQGDVDGICTIQSCGSVCVPCQTGWGCCGEAWGACWCWYPQFDSCCYTITDPACLVANTACYALKEPIKALLDVAEFVVDQSRHTLDLAILALDATQGVVSAAEYSLDAAIYAIEATKHTYRVGTEAVNVIASVGLGGVINIKGLEFDVYLSAAATGSFSGSITASFAGQQDVTVSLNLNLYDIPSMAKKLGEHVVEGISDFIG